MKDLLEYLVRELAGEPDAVVVREHAIEEGRAFEVHVAAADLGRIIGRGGRTVRALRTVIRAAAPAGERVSVEGCTNIAAWRCVVGGLSVAG